MQRISTEGLANYVILLAIEIHPPIVFLSNFLFALLAGLLVIIFTPVLLIMSFIGMIEE